MCGIVGWLDFGRDLRERELLTDIVRRQLVADVPLSSMLSGGLDSGQPAAPDGERPGRCTVRTGRDARRPVATA
jgi:hypothetical protein